MHKCLRKLLFGLIIWAVPFVTSFFIWDVEAGAPSISMMWFNAIMAFTWSIGFAIAVYLYFRKAEKGVKEAWITGVVWYVQLVLLDLIFLVFVFGNAFSTLYPMMLVYLNTLIITASIGYIRQ